MAETSPSTTRRFPWDSGELQQELQPSASIESEGTLNSSTTATTGASRVANGIANGTDSKTYGVIAPSNFPGERHSLAGISFRAFALGLTLGVSLFATLSLLWTCSPLWRSPFFMATLSLFHFLEFYTTAAYNTNAASTSAFILSSNGPAYHAAHTLALLESTISHSMLSYPVSLSTSVRSLLLVIGFGLLVVGQIVRSMAMVQAGKNFNHNVQYKKAETHELVTTGIYGYLRHPSYFGFFWWGLGSQIILGNPICLLGYTYVLWTFFRSRIKTEERYLIEFFGIAYHNYRSAVPSGIPFVL